MEGDSKMDTGGEILQKSHSVARCAKAAVLLLSLKRSPAILHRQLESISYETQEKEMMEKEIEDLRLRLTRERMKTRNSKRCGVLLVATQIALMISLWSLILVFASDFY